ncbi:unnamed protein product [Eruca vesicaria subsp. sativa]|uniref:Uncharacterized protein n=1 Tax=Eruca vesicaria subsp. sativa TaxID=29727 RepID=A0ABC8JNL8_ERUVS|nr:unnamed protein product [Eruca vesicaria subsp. sativa]
MYRMLLDAHPSINTDHMNSQFLHPVTLKSNEKQRMKHMLYFLLALTVVSAATARPGEPVLDVDGDNVSDGSYYVLPRILGAAGGGLTLVPSGGNKCPLYIGQGDSSS